MRSSVLTPLDHAGQTLGVLVLYVRRDSESTSVTGRNRCTAEDFRGVPIGDITMIGDSMPRLIDIRLSPGHGWQT
jgi:hypothetical protein